MVKKKDITNELKEYNLELEKHMPNLNLDSLNDLTKLTNDGMGPNEDFLALLVNNVGDLRTEIALLRKNLTDSVEGMVMRIVKNNQSQFSNQVANFNSKLVLDIKSSFSSYVAQVVEEMSEIRKQFSQVVSSNENLSNQVENLSQEISVLKTLRGDIDIFKDELKKEHSSKTKEFLSRLDVIEKSLVDQNKRRIADNKRFIEVFNSFGNKFGLLYKQIEEKEDVRDQRKDVNSFEKGSFHMDNSLDDIKDKIFENNIVNMKDSYDSSTVKKILTIDDRIRKLEALRN